MFSVTRRRYFLTRGVGCAAIAAAAKAMPLAAHDTRERASGPRPLPDMLDYMVRTLGPPRQAQLVSTEETAAYKDRVPPRLIRFWQEQGRGSYFDGMYWICDPAPFTDVLDYLFKDDPEFVSADMTAVAYTAFGQVKVWDRRRANMSLYFPESQVHCPPERSHINSLTGERFPDDYMIATTVAIVSSEYLPSTLEFLQAARSRLGPLAPGEVYGFFPALQLGGAYAVENLRRVKAAEHFMLPAQLAPMNLVALTPPEPPRFPYGR
jgi:hypothetical protein